MLLPQPPPPILLPPLGVQVWGHVTSTLLASSGPSDGALLAVSAFSKNFLLKTRMDQNTKDMHQLVRNSESCALPQTSGM